MRYFHGANTYRVHPGDWNEAYGDHTLHVYLHTRTYSILFLGVFFCIFHSVFRIKFLGLLDPDLDM